MKTILIVEDEKPLREVYATLFKLQKFSVMEASNGQEALKLLQNIIPDIIIVDLLMPIMGGLEFLKKVRPKTNYPKLKVLVLSNLSDPQTISRVSMLGANKYMLKASLSPTELYDTVRELLSIK